MTSNIEKMSSMIADRIEKIEQEQDRLDRMVWLAVILAASAAFFEFIR